MKCPVCQHDMIQSKQGWLCHNCGHLEAGAAEPTVTPPAAAIVKDKAQSFRPANPLAPSTPPPPAPAAPVSAPTSPSPAPQGVVMPQEFRPPDPKPDRKGLKLALVIGGIVVLLLGGGGAFAYQAFVLSPKEALAGYLSKIASAHTANFDTSVDWTGSSQSSGANLFGNNGQITLTGQYDISNAKNPKVSLDASAKFGGATGLSGSFRYLDSTAYFKLNSAGALSGLLGSSFTNDWYYYKVTQQQSDCTNLALIPTSRPAVAWLDDVTAAASNTGTFLGFRYPTALPVKDTKLVSLSQTVSGHRTEHFSGAIDFAALPGYLDKVNQSLPSSCRITYDKSSFSNMAASYDLWTSSSFDRLTMVVTDTSQNGSTTTVSMDTTKYNQPVSIQAPSGAKDLTTVFGGASAYTPPTPTFDSYLPTTVPSGYHLFDANFMDQSSGDYGWAAYTELSYIYGQNDLGAPEPFSVDEYIVPSTYNPPADCGDFKPDNKPYIHIACSSIGQVGGQPVYYAEDKQMDFFAAYCKFGNILVVVNSTVGTKLTSNDFYSIMASMKKTSWSNIQAAIPKQ